MNIADLIYATAETVTVFDYITGDYLFTLDELQNVSIANSQETSEITGKNGRKLANLKRNKSVTISGTNGLVSGGLMEAQTGSEFKHVDGANVMWTDYITVGSDGVAKTNYKAVGTAGKEIEKLIIKKPDGTVASEMTQAASAEAGKFAYAPDTKILSFHSGEAPAAGTELVAYYKRKMAADVMENMSDTYSKKVTMYVDYLAEDKCANTYRLQYCFPKVDFSGEFSIEAGDSQTVHAFEAEALAGACGANAPLFSYTIFGANADDVA